MSEAQSDLEHLRRRIDEIDDRLQDLLIERVGIIAEVAAQKRQAGAVAPHQPAREAEIIRRLVRRGGGAFPPATLVRMWRELLAATVRLQGNFAVAVYAPPDKPGFWDLARDHYGSQTPMQAYGSAPQVIGAVTEGQAAVGVLPMPQEGETDPWWRHMLSTRPDAPHVIARLPFGARGNARTDGVGALAIGRGVPQPSGRDRTLLATENAEGISRGRIVALLSELGLSCSFLAACEHADGAHCLIEIDDFLPFSDPRVASFRDRLGRGLSRLVPFGGYAVPLSPVELGQAAGAEARQAAGA
ncbi:MAG TPA: chorismate mutase [Stellaceae bacterium]|nr:chorismate mutase [Stellaceae bacterium]